MSDCPLWVLALEAGGGDPLRAKEIWESVDETWWVRYLAYRREIARAMESKTHGR